MATSAKIVLGSTTKWGAKVRTYELTYPRFIHAEIMTHRMFSRNTASSRAIPVSKMIESLAGSPDELFERLGLNQSGMQAKETQLTEKEKYGFNESFSKYRDDIISMAQDCIEINLHKQIANRFIEPLMHITCIVTATDMDNFFAQRCHPAAQPELQSLAFKMLKCEIEYPWGEHVLHHGDYHLPYITEEERTTLSMHDKKKISVARVASVSYVKHGEGLIKEKCLEIFQKLLLGGHWSPFEHVCCPGSPNQRDLYSGNLKGWSQYRKEFMGENRTEVDYEHLYSTKPDWIK